MMKKTITFFLAALFTLVSVTSIFAQNSFSVKYVGQSSRTPSFIKVEADYDRHNHFLYPPNSSTQTTAVLESKYINNGTTVAYLSAPSFNTNTGQTFELFKLNVTWNEVAPNGFLIPKSCQISNLQILAANSSGNIITIQPKVRLKATYSGTLITYEVILY
ncbi:hypothetical protein CLU96_0182 [Chryseobacterium sp. 52]|uniref:hypothetical protein n=1 Tax=Chryseobacterium sp. 52 TaxID=2035213 RepID=UPI000C17EE1A|nr:hypothetical protein [Chryseobacterium sp. 52]PIF43278.1 hypothetical protein CLU96_0182 [Chryseobacterium sp. 52]